MATRCYLAAPHCILVEDEGFLTVDIAHKKLAQLVLLAALRLVAHERYELAPCRCFFLLVEQVVHVVFRQLYVLLAYSEHKAVARGDFMQAAQLVYNRAVQFNIVLLQELAQQVLAFGPRFPFVAAQKRTYLALRLGCICVSEPFGLHMLRARCKNLNLVATLQFIAQRHEFVIHLCANAMAAQERVN